jgi:hypothetical protein
MPFVPVSWRRLVSVFALACVSALAATGSGADDARSAKRPPLPEFRTLGLAPEIRAAMVEFGIPVESGPTSSEEGKGDLAGDWVVLLGTLTDEEKISRWVIQLRTVPTPDGAPAEPVSLVRYSSTGNQETLSRRKAAIEVTVLRPLAKRKTTNVVLANEDALNAGLWGFVSSQLKLKANPDLGRGHAPEFADAPFPKARVDSERAAALALGLTPDEEWARELTLPALNEFLSLILSTPELVTMMARVTEIPLLAVMGGAREATIATLPFESTIPTSRLGMKGEDTAYVLPLMVSLGKKPVLLCQLVLVPPHPPLHVGAGLVGLAAGHPDGKGPLLTIEFVAASVAR